MVFVTVVVPGESQPGQRSTGHNRGHHSGPKRLRDKPQEGSSASTIVSRSRVGEGSSQQLDICVKVEV